MTAPPPGETDHLRETPLERHAVHQGRLLDVFADDVRLANGERAVREVVEHPGAVAIIARAEDGRVVLVRQWRHAVSGALWEIPAGTREPAEDPRRTAERELREETGYSAAHWRHLIDAAVSPGYSSEIVSFFAAEGLVAGDPGADADEALDVGLFAGGELAALLSSGQTDIKTVAGLALAGLASTSQADVPAGAEGEPGG